MVITDTLMQPKCNQNATKMQPNATVTVFYTLTKIHQPTPIGKPIISRNDGPTERISAFVDSLLQPIAKSQNPYLNTLYNFIERTKLPENTLMLSFDVTSLNTNIPQGGRGSTQYAEHTRTSTGTTPPSRPSPSEKF